MKLILLTVLPVLVLCAALAFVVLKKNMSDLTMLAICFMVGGGIGNIYDRILYGSVTDFLHIDFGLFQTGIFNLADVAIMSGVVIAFADAYRRRLGSGNTQ